VTIAEIKALPQYQAALKAALANPLGNMGSLAFQIYSGMVPAQSTLNQIVENPADFFPV
jgi:hypothetical protein